MYHLILILLAGVLMYLGWQLVHCAPRVLSMVLPAKLSFGLGVGVLVIALFAAYMSAYVLKSPEGVIGSFVKVYVGLWFMCAASAAARGTESDERMLKRVFALLGMMMAMIMAILYFPDMQAVSIFALLMVAGGFWVTANFLQSLDRGR